MTSGQVLITRGETPYEARLRYQSEAYQEALSFHSSIPNNAEHSREVLAYDIAIGAGESVDDMPFYEYLCRVADWRIDWKRKDEGLTGHEDAEARKASFYDFYRQEKAETRALIDETLIYKTNGAFPVSVPGSMPSLIASQSLSGRLSGVPICFGDII